MRIAFDTNVLAYAEAVNDEARRDRAALVIDSHRQDELFVPVQALGELFSVLMRKSGLSALQAKARIGEWSGTLTPIATTPEVLKDAMSLVEAHRIGVWDAIVMSASASVGCDLLLTEDMQHGFTWRGVTVRNPFATDPRRPHMIFG